MFLPAYPVRFIPMDFCFVDRAIRHAQGTIGAVADRPKEVLEAYRAYFEKSVGSRDAFEILFQFLRHARPEKADSPMTNSRPAVRSFGRCYRTPP